MKMIIISQHQIDKKRVNDNWIFDGFVIKNHEFLANLGYKLHFYRTQAGTEVDFIACGPRGLHAFEIKGSATVTPKSFKGLKTFQEDYPQAKLHLYMLTITKSITAISKSFHLREHCLSCLSCYNK